MNTFTIKDLENLSGIKAHTIRIWEQRYGLLSPQRSKTNIRHYSNVELKAILNIALLNKYGYKISRIDKMTPEEMQQKIAMLSQSEAQQEKLINDLVGAMVDVNIDQFETLLDEHIRNKGIEKAIIRTIFPFLEKVGKSRYNQEQYVKNLAKWEAANAWCKQQGIRFRVVNEDDIFHKGSKRR